MQGTHPQSDVLEWPNCWNGGMAWACLGKVIAIALVDAIVVVVDVVELTQPRFTSAEAKRVSYVYLYVLYLIPPVMNVSEVRFNVESEWKSYNM